jgi:hypothetical protein
MKSILPSHPLALILTSVSILSLSAQEGEDKPKPVTLSMALELGPEKLTKYTDESESGQDMAADLYAIAKRLETENALAKKDLSLVGELNYWRETLSNCRKGSLSLASFINGGGTMYSHASNRDGSLIEDFLSSFAKRLPLKEGEGDPKANKQIDAAIAQIKKLKGADSGDDQSNKEMGALMEAERADTIDEWENLKMMISSVSAEEATKIVKFAADSLKWLKVEE